MTLASAARLRTLDAAEATTLRVAAVPHWQRLPVPVGDARPLDSKVGSGRSGMHQTPKSPMPGHRGLFSRSRPSRDSPKSRPNRIGAKIPNIFPIPPNRDRENPGYFPGQIGTGRDGDSGISGSGFHPQKWSHAASPSPTTCILPTASEVHANWKLKEATSRTPAQDGPFQNDPSRFRT